MHNIDEIKVVLKTKSHIAKAFICRLIFLSVLFLIESCMEVGVLSICLMAFKKDSISISNFLLRFEDNTMVLKNFKLKFFLPVYTLYYLVIKKNITQKIIIKHFEVHSSIMIICSMFFLPFLMSSAGLIGLIMFALGSLLAIFLIKLIIGNFYRLGILSEYSFENVNEVVG